MTRDKALHLAEKLQGLQVEEIAEMLVEALDKAYWAGYEKRALEELKEDGV